METTALHQDVLNRHHRLLLALPLPGTSPELCPSTTQLLETMGSAYGETSLAARRRTLQRDLKTLIGFELAEAVNPGGKPLRFCQRQNHLMDDELAWAYALECLICGYHQSTT